MKTRLAYLLLFGCMLFAAIEGADAAVSSVTADFAQQAAMGNQFEISSSQLALKDSHNKDIKQFAQQMIDDHKQLGDQMSAVLASSGAPAPSTNLDPMHQDMMTALNKTPANEFDRQYIKMQVDGHKEAQTLYSDYASKGDDPAMKNFAAQSLPAIQQHLQYSEKLSAGY